LIGSLFLVSKAIPTIISPNFALCYPCVFDSWCTNMFYPRWCFA